MKMIARHRQKSVHLRIEENQTTSVMVIIKGPNQELFYLALILQAFCRFVN
jgi:hypothetical protein